MRICRSSEALSIPLEDEHSVFLVGPTPRSPLVASWRPDALSILSDLKYKGLIYVPEPFAGDYKLQMDWEYRALRECKVIAAWVCRVLPDMPAFTTNIEFGEWFRNRKFIYGRPDNTPHTNYMDARYSTRDLITGLSSVPFAFGTTPYNDLHKLLVAATEGFCG